MLPNPSYQGTQNYNAQNVQQPGNQVDELMKKMTKMMQQQFGLKPRGQAVSYKRPYPEWYDLVALPPHYRILEFSKFTGQDNTSTIEHVSRYITQLGEASVEDAHKVRFLSLSLIGPAFTWFLLLPANSIGNWADLENKFHAYFYAGVGEKTMADLADMKQRANESGVEFIKRFREAKNLCFSLTLPDNQVAALAVRGLMPPLKEKLAGGDYESLSQLAQKVAVLDNQLQGGPRDNRLRNGAAVVESCDFDESDDEVAVAEWNWGKRAVLVPKPRVWKKIMISMSPRQSSCSISC